MISFWYQWFSGNGGKTEDPTSNQFDPEFVSEKDPVALDSFSLTQQIAMSSIVLLLGRELTRHSVRAPLRIL